MKLILRDLNLIVAGACLGCLIMGLAINYVSWTMGLLILSAGLNIYAAIGVATPTNTKLAGN